MSVLAASESARPNWRMRALSLGRSSASIQSLDDLSGTAMGAGTMPVWHQRYSKTARLLAPVDDDGVPHLGTCHIAAQTNSNMRLVWRTLLAASDWLGTMRKKRLVSLKLK
ncbi:hypothetical protein Plhal304r1_c003g0011261 [Plasmopara halstedii]